jgi:pyruvate dehydrogenase E1 component alpha subunit
MSDPQKYRTKEELEEYQSIDPIERLKAYILKEGIRSEADLKAVEDGIEQEVLDAVTFADESPFPEDFELYEDMFVEENPYFHV